MIGKGAFWVCAFLLSLALFQCAAAFETTVDPQHQCIALSEIRALVLQPGEAQRERSASVPRLQCAGNCPSDARLDSAHCTNAGTDDSGMPTWRCVPMWAAYQSSVSSGRTSSERRLALGNVRVQCEGCLRRGDSNVRKGSCSLTYSVVDARRTTQHNHRSARQHHRSEEGPGDWIVNLLLLSFIVMSVVLCYKAYTNKHGDTSHGTEHHRHHATYSQYEHSPYGGPNTTGTKDHGAPVVGVPVHGHNQQHHHHHHNNNSGGGGYSGPGFGTGMFAGYLLGNAMGGSHFGGGGGMYGDGSGDSMYDTADATSGGWGASDGGGFGGTDSM